jgi:hypothetical protein
MRGLQRLCINLSLCTADGMKRVVMFERESAVCVLDEFFGDWKGSQKSNKISGFVAFFLQFSKEIDGGGRSKF